MENLKENNHIEDEDISRDSGGYFPNLDNQNDNNSKLKRKRRSKNDQEGRNYKCNECGKSYLSPPALTNHKKTKHATNNADFKRGRGRPRKNVNTLLKGSRSQLLRKARNRNSIIFSKKTLEAIAYRSLMIGRRMPWRL